MLNLIICAVLLTVTSDVVHGRYVDSPQMHGGFTVHKIIKTWEQADIQCKSEGAVLASPNTTELLNVMRSLIGINSTPYFIGSKTTNDFGTFRLTEDHLSDNMTATVMGMIKKLDPYDGDCLSMDENKISVVPCCIRLPFICYKATEDSEITTEAFTTTEEIIFETTTDQVWVETTTDQDSGQKICPSGYRYFESVNKCYKMYTDMKTFDDAISTCKDEGANLIIVNDIEEATLIKDNFYLNGYPHTFVGLRDITTYGEWRTITGEPMSEVYHVWRNGGPTGQRGDTFNCAVIRPEGDLEDFSCDIVRDFICEI